MKSKDEPAVREIYSPGGLLPEAFFEQVKDMEYVTYAADGSTFATEPQLVMKDGPVYKPLPKTPWKLCKQSVPYEPEALWEEIWQFIYDHLFLPDKALYDVLTAWVIATWIPEVWTVVPYVFFFGPIASGKTRGLEVLHRLAYRGILSSNISSAALYRACELWHPTLILDETEIYNKTERYEVIGLLNSGYRRGQYAVRVKNTEHGCELEVFDVFGFKALAGTEGLAKTLESRSIMVRMIKNRRHVRLFIDEGRANDLRGKLLTYRFTTLHFKHDLSTIETPLEQDLAALGERLLETIPELKVESGRLQELFQPLLAVSNAGRENIARYAERVEEIQQFEERASEEAEVVNILLNATVTLTGSVVMSSAIATAFNEHRPEKERWKTSSIGRIMRRLGFQQRHTKHGNGWHIDVERLRYLQEIYLADGGEGSENASPPSPPSPPNDGDGHSHTILGEGSEASEGLSGGGGPYQICQVCHEEKPLSQFSTKLGKPTCKRCAGEEIEE